MPLLVGGGLFSVGNAGKHRKQPRCRMGFLAPGDTTITTTKDARKPSKKNKTHDDPQEPAATIQPGMVPSPLRVSSLPRLYRRWRRVRRYQQRWRWRWRRRKRQQRGILRRLCRFWIRRRREHRCRRLVRECRAGGPGNYVGLATAVPETGADGASPQATNQRKLEGGILGRLGVLAGPLHGRHRSEDRGHVPAATNSPR
mmetsp:Transcript_102059/g.207573  ORF Transcript_102059/g.207573 Transcript_102059/m.207573 type:complete len:200 (-) Transcript_102059:5-604(-)